MVMRRMLKVFFGGNIAPLLSIWFSSSIGAGSTLLILVMVSRLFPDIAPLTGPLPIELGDTTLPYLDFRFLPAGITTGDATMKSDIEWQLRARMDPLKGKYTPFQRLLHKFQARRDIPLRRKFFMGYDLHGNTYWEFTLDGNMQRLRRKLEPYQEQLFKADYALTIPPQWLSWLRRTRATAPTLEELASDQLRQERIKVLAQAASDKWYLEKQRMEEEHQLKLEQELQRATQPVQAPANEDPWAAADKKDPGVEEASIEPRR